MNIKNLNKYSLEQKLFIQMLVFSIFLSLISVGGNVLIGLPFAVNYKWVALVLLGILALKYSLERKYEIFFQTTIFSLIIFVFLPHGWITSGGANVISVAYLFLICIAMCLIFHGRLRVFFVLAQMVMTVFLLYMQVYYPQIIGTPSSEKYTLDMFIQMPLTLLAGAYMVVIFSNAYRKEKRKLEEYGKHLKESNQRLMQIAQIDELTGTYNRRYLFEKLEEVRVQIGKENRKAMIIMIDIDDFKTINDTFGHIVGDELLRSIGRCMIEIVKGKGFVGRYGGDEFIMVLQDVSLREAKNIVDQIQKQVTQSYGNDRLGVTLSGGMAQLMDGDDVDDILVSVDNILYHVKRSSKNNILYEKDLDLLEQVN